MPRKAKDKIEEILEVLKNRKSSKSAEKVAAKNGVAKKATNAKKAVSEKDKSKKAASTNIVAEKDTSKKNATKNTTAAKSTAKKATTKSATSAKSTTKKSTTKKASTANVAPKEASNTKKATNAKKAVSKKDSVKKATSTNSNTKKATRKTSSRKTQAKKLNIEEYYDLPNKYEQTIVKILAQTPTILFVYWEISSKDRNKFIKEYGENFFNETSPYLIVINKDKNYQFEVEINDYANSWYLHIPDSDCKYEVILSRKNKNSQILPQNSITIVSSNQIETPNDHILFEKLGKTIFFKDVKSGYVQSKDISSFAFMHNIGRIYNIYDLYKEIYKNELNGDELGIKLSSSQFSSSFK